MSRPTSAELLAAKHRAATTAERSITASLASIGKPSPTEAEMIALVELAYEAMLARATHQRLDLLDMGYAKLEQDARQGARAASCECDTCRGRWARMS